MKQPNFLKILKLVATPSLWDVDVITNSNYL